MIFESLILLFYFSETHHQLISTTTAFIFGIPIVVDIPAGYEDACLFHEGRVGTNSCPLEAGEIFTWDLHSPIDGSFPAQTNIPLESKLNEKILRNHWNSHFLKLFLLVKILQGTSVSLCARMNVNVVWDLDFIEQLNENTILYSFEMNEIKWNCLKSEILFFTHFNSNFRMFY